MITTYPMNNGWSCVKCGYSWSPSTPGCYNCNRPENEKYRTTTEAVHICNLDSTGRCVICNGQIGSASK